MTTKEEVRGQSEPGARSVVGGTDLVNRIERFMTDPLTRSGAHAVYHQARERLGGLVALPGGAWVTLSQAATHAVILDDAASRWESATHELGEIGDEGNEFDLALDAMRVMLMNRDNPDHLRMRRILRHAFSPAAVKAWRGTVERLCAEIGTRAIGLGEYDFLKEVAYPLPEGVMCALLRVPREDHDKWSVWTRDNVAANRAVALDEGTLAKAQQSAVNFYRYVSKLITARRLDLGDDLISLMIRAQEKEGERLSEQELIGTVIQFIQAAHDTTANLIGNAMVVLLRDRPLYDRLRARPDDVEKFVHEVLRMDGPVHFALPRTAVAKISYGDKTIPVGSPVIAVWAAANRDPAVFVDPDRFDVDRPNNQRHLAFGTGMHNCIGRPLAMLEIVEMMRMVVTSMPVLELAEEPERSPEYLNLWKEIRVRRA